MEYYRLEKEFEGSISLEGREEGLGGIKGEAGAKVKKSNTLTEIIAAINENTVRNLPRWIKCWNRFKMIFLQMTRLLNLRKTTMRSCLD